MQRRKCARAVSYSVAIILGGWVAFGGDAKAQDSNFGQFLAGKATGADLIGINPTPFEMIALAIDFDEANGDFSSCQGFTIPPFGSADFDNGSRGTILVISVPTSAEGNSNAGKVKQKKFGLLATARKKAYLAALNPKDFKLHPDPTEQAAQLTACCTEIADEGESRKIFKAFKIVCPE